MTIHEITEAIQPHKLVSKRQVIRYMNACKIKPSGARQRPQRYPDNSANLVLVHLGIVPPVRKSFEADKRATKAGIPSLNALRAEKKKARGK
jgi:hypothetical protein